MLAGFGTTTITPPIGTRLNGFIARLTPSTGVDLPLAARVLWLEDDETACLVVTLDVLGLSTSFADRIVQGLADRFGVSERHVLLASTHTHSGPMTCRLRGVGEVDEEYLNVVESRIHDAASEAATSKRPVKVGWGAAPVAIGVNRREIDPSDGGVVLGRNPAGPADRTVEVLHLRGEAFSAVLFTHACHPCCLGPQHSLISPDFPGHAAAVIEDSGHHAMFLNGCAGDINPYLAFQGQEAAHRAGQELADAVLQACKHARYEEAPRLRMESVRIDIPHDALPELATVEAQLGKADRTVRPEDRDDRIVQAQIKDAWDEWLAELSRARMGDGGLPTITARLSVIRIGRAAIVALPGEVFFQIGQAIAAQLDADPVCVAAYCHGYIGYVPVRQAFADGGYEVEESHRFVGLWRTSPVTEDLLLEQVERLWKSQPCS